MVLLFSRLANIFIWSRFKTSSGLNKCTRLTTLISTKITRNGYPNCDEEMIFMMNNFVIVVVELEVGKNKKCDLFLW